MTTSFLPSTPSYSRSEDRAAPPIAWADAISLLSPATRALLRRDERLCHYTTLRVGGPADWFLNAANVDTLAEISAVAQRYGLPHFILGLGSNVCMSDKGVRGLVVRNACCGANIGPDTYVESGHSFAALFHKTLRADLSGLEFAVGIPGTVGGALVSNAGAYRGEICELVQSIEVVVDGERRWAGPEWMGFSYRDSRLRRTDAPPATLLAARLRLTPGARPDIRARARDFQQQRLRKQPWKPSAGSFFKNVNDQALADRLPDLPPLLKRLGKVPAAFLLEHCGCKGLTVGGAALSLRHANFLLNLGGATASDVRQVAAQAKARVRDRFGVCLEEEVLYVGEF